MKILIADDERTIRNGLAGLIQRWFPAWEVVGLAENGKQALRMAVQEKPQIFAGGYQYAGDERPCDD